MVWPAIDDFEVLLVITTVIHSPAFTFAEGCESDTGAVAFAPSCACLKAAIVQENVTCH